MGFFRNLLIKLGEMIGDAPARMAKCPRCNAHVKMYMKEGTQAVEWYLESHHVISLRFDDKLLQNVNETVECGGSNVKVEINRKKGN